MDETVQAPSSPPSSKSHMPRLLISGVVMLLVGIGVGYIVPPLISPQNTQKPQSMVLPSPSENESFPSPTLQAEKVIINDADWIRTDTLGVITYVYPKGWHVAEIWPTNGNDGIRVSMSTEPISTAPRGGSFDEVAFVLENGLPNAEEVLQKKMTTFKQDTTVLEEKELQGEMFKVKYIKGRMSSEAYGDRNIDSYYLFIPSQNPNDKLNDNIIWATIGSDSKNAPMLQKILLSIMKKSY